MNHCNGRWGMAGLLGEKKREIYQAISFLWRSDDLSNSWNSWKQQNYLWWSIWWWWQRESNKNRQGLFYKKRWVSSWDFNSDWRSVFRDKWTILLWNTTDRADKIRETLPFLLSSLHKHHPQWQWQWLQICPTSGNFSHNTIDCFYSSITDLENGSPVSIALSMLWLHLNNDKYEGFVRERSLLGSTHRNDRHIFW